MSSDDGNRPRLHLTRAGGRTRVHPWIYRGEIAGLEGEPEPGAAVTVIDGSGAFAGVGFYNPRTSLACRILTRREEAVDAAFFAARIAGALAYRRAAGLASDAYRLVWSEGDGLPGLVVDRYGAVSVVQCFTLGMSRVIDWIAAGLRAAVGDGPVYLADDPAGARLEGFEPRRGWLDREGPETVTVREGDARFRVRLGAGHKTGFYLDQAENRARVGRRAAGRRVLDAFSYSGGFAVHALAAGAEHAICLDSSPEALAGARENLALNGLAERAELREVNAFDELRRLEREHARFGLVILDPPPFTRRRDALEAARRGYKEINLRAMRLLGPGGLLATFSCSHHVSPAFFEDVCRAAAEDAGVTLRTLGALTQSGDHPVLLTVPETRYLKGLLLERL
ncbi:MAG: class I SAM-dependent rRNA methyltransferase [Candidatus Rokubacteria bacterium]|nr:class I SAM-dependent rRNA methyltransferase [Candidatus Rokubacteria bacterium]